MYITIGSIFSEFCFLLRDSCPFSLILLSAKPINPSDALSLVLNLYVWFETLLLNGDLGQPMEQFCSFGR
ncbi:hypothetical protein VNO80_12653 [Phaseolus coccineus]|uniref:Uncharacterized protein n=1 Tax=Phaseolus coccineus TaxID=3886 RepID=A0AAN9MZZ6_PHACN